MEKVELRTADIAAENAAKLAEQFPDIVTEVLDEDGNVRHSIDVEALKAHVGDIAEDKRERYQFTWPGKQKARAEAIRPIDKTMRPCVDESVNWDTTENLYIEGDNLDALKILRETYAGKIKMIYIDPPYNTGHDFIYKDSRKQSKEDLNALSSFYDDEGNRMDNNFQLNSESSGTFHSDWCSMMLPRLQLARDLLSEDGAAFISIDDCELATLIKISDEVFGASNFIGQWNWFKSATPPNLSKKIKKNIEYVVCYGKYSSGSRFKGRVKTSQSANGLLNQTNRFAKLIFPKGVVETKLPDGTYPDGPYGTENYEINLLNAAVVKDGRFVTEVALEAKFKWSQDNLNREIERGTRIFIQTKSFSPSYEKREYEPEVPPNLIGKDVGVDTTEQAGKALRALFDGVKVFDYPKPIDLIQYLAGFLVEQDDIVLDFFSGSASTAHAVMQLNAEDGGNRKFIMVQLPEVCDEKSEAAKAGYSTICEIGKERIRRAGAKIAAEVEEANAQLKLGEEPKKIPDIGFRVLKIDSSNFEDVQRTPDTLSQDALFGLADNVKPGRTPEDILFQLFPKLEIPYTARIDTLDICGKTVYSVDDDTLVACFDREVPEDVVRAMAEREPAWAVLRDASFTGDDALANFEEIFKTVSPETKTRVV